MVAEQPEHIRRGSSRPVQTPEIAPETEVMAPPPIRSSTYTMSQEEFTQIIPPLLLKYPFGPIFISNEDAALLCVSTGKDYPESYHARDAIKWKHNDATIDVSGQLRFNYEMLRRAKEDGCSVAIISAHDNCKCMRHIAGREVLVDEALAAFEGRKSSAPIIPPTELPCCFDQDVQTPCQSWIFGRAEWNYGAMEAPQSELAPV